MKALTIRRVDEQLAEALEREKARRAESLNRTVLDLLRQALGIGAAGRRSNGLGELSGAWSQEELAEFERNTAGFEQVDEEMWR
jgi:hypothetical protein